jgi:hypothetical protein
MANLGGVDAVVAIQATEARSVGERLGGAHVILAPMAASPVEAPQHVRAQQPALQVIGISQLPQWEAASSMSA